MDGEGPETKEAKKKIPEHDLDFSILSKSIRMDAKCIKSATNLKMFISLVEVDFFLKEETKQIIAINIY